MKRKLVFLPAVYSKEVVENINGYFDKGYEIEDILDAENGCYLLLILAYNDCCAYKYAKKFDSSEDTCVLIEERHYGGDQCWHTTSTQDTKVN